MLNNPTIYFVQIQHQWQLIIQQHKYGENAVDTQVLNIRLSVICHNQLYAAGSGHKGKAAVVAWEFSNIVNSNICSIVKSTAT